MMLQLEKVQQELEGCKTQKLQVENMQQQLEDFKSQQSAAQPNGVPHTKLLDRCASFLDYMRGLSLPCRLSCH